MSPRRRLSKQCAGSVGLLALAAVMSVTAQLSPAAAEEPKAPVAAPASDTRTIRIILARELRDRLPPLSLLDQPPKDEASPAPALPSTTTIRPASS